MKNSIKRVIAPVLAMLLVLFIAMPTVEANAASVSWNFKTTNFKSLGTISSTKTVDNLGLIATSSKTMSVKAEKVTVSGTEYTYCLALSGTGSTSYRAVKVPVSGASTLKVVLRSSGSSDRTLVVADSNGKQIGTMTAKSAASQATYSYTGKAGYVYLYSSGSGINIYKIQADSASTTSSTTTTTTTPTTTTTTTTAPSNSITVKNGGTTLAQAIKSAKAGTTIIIDGKITSGAISVPAGVNIQGKNNATIDFSQTSGSTGKGLTFEGNGSSVSDITVIKASDNGIFVTGNNNTFTRVNCYYNEDAGFQISNGGAYNKFIKCNSRYNADATGENADGFACKLHSGEGNYFEECIAEYNSDDGWDCYAAHGVITLVNCQANYNGYYNGIYGDGNGFKMGGVDNKTPGVAAHIDRLDHKLTGCIAKGNYRNGFDRNNQGGVVTMENCIADSNKGKNFNWPLDGTPSALGYKYTFGKAIIKNCTNINSGASNNLTGATLVGTNKGF